MPEIPFTIDDIEDVRIIIKAKGKHFSIVPKENLSEEAKIARIAVTDFILEYHAIVSTALEDLKTVQP